MTVPSTSAPPNAKTHAINRRARTATGLFRLYKTVASPLIHAFVTSRCKYLPTCSEYAYVAVVQHGWVHGSWLALCRLARCHPFARGGHDPVPGAAPSLATIYHQPQSGCASSRPPKA